MIQIFKKFLIAAFILAVAFTSGAQVTITYKVDITNYLAGGATLGANGMRIGGNFGDLNSPLPNWQPSAIQCGMINTGNNVWSISVTYPATSIGQTQNYKFVNNDWGTNEGFAGSTIASGGCGTDDGAGNINRTFIIPASNATICFNWDACTSCQASSGISASTVSPATAITANSATIAGSATGSGITSRGICYATTQNPTVFNSTSSAGNGSGDFSSNLTGLNPATTYYARAFASDANSTVYGNQISFTTLPSLDITATTGTSSNVTSATADVSGSVSGTNITNRGVCYGTATNPTIADSVANAGSGIGSFTANLTNLTPNTTYYARAFGSGPAGTAYGSQISFTTQPAQPQGISITYRVDITNYLTAGNSLASNGIRIAGNFADRGATVNGTAMVNWTPTNAASAMSDEGNNLWSITVTYPSASAAQTQAYKFVNGDWGANEGGTGSAILTGQCGVDDGSGNINRTFVIPSTAQTLTFCWDECSVCGGQATAPVVTTAIATAITASSASVPGTATGTGITARGVCFATTQNPTIANSVANAGTGEGNFTASLSGLNPNTLYYARAFATNAAGTSYGAQISFTTQPGTPVQTVNVTYKVDVTNYIAAGNTIAANGIRIAGNFADRGAKVNGTAMVNWTPTDAASAMTNTGNNIWSVTVTYPDSSFTKPQLYKFVNGNWAGSGGDNEGVAGSGIEAGQCGISDPDGNVNRILIIPSTAQTLNYCWDQCSPCTTATALTVTTAASATAITANTASIGGTATGTGITARGVCFATTQNPTIANSVANAGTGEGNFTASLSGLNPNTLYYARAFATNAGGTSYGAQISFTTQPGTPVQTVNVTYKVDVTNYIAAGNAIAANGIRIAGNFADRGAKVNGTAMVNWTPTDAASAMTNAGNNVWSVTVTYPDSSLAKTQLYKFVNGNWGANEGGTSSAILTGQCGVDDGSGNINRTFAIPATAQTLSYCWDECAACTTASAPVVTTAAAATAITANTASVGGTATGTGITVRGVCFATTQNPTIANSVANAGTGEGNFTASLSGLNPNTLYYARAFATNAGGTSYGAQISFTTQPGTPVQTVNVTYKVDVTNYVAAGNTIAANGIRIAGNFADRGAKVNGTAMVNWTPTDAASAMTNAGNNVWSVTITYPDTSVAKTQLYKFVNGNWGANEGGTGSAILTGQCGLDDGSGNINRTFVIPSTAQTLTYCWDECAACTTASAPVVTTAASATAITANTASVGGTATGTGITARGVCYATTQSPTIAGTIASAGTGEGAFTANLSGLNPSTLYYARAYATNASGTSYGTEISFTTQPGTPVQTVNVTYKVDVTNYIAAGNTIAANGIRIAGNFADRGAKVNGTAMVNWTPTDAASAMTNAGNNVWSVTVTYPDTSAAKIQSYKFVNGNWGANEGGAGSNILSGGCGADDGSGNINRVLVIPSAAASNLAYCWDQCESVCTPTSVSAYLMDEAKAFPNPFDAELTVMSRGTASFKIISLLGKVVSEGQLNAGNNRIETQSLPKGVYMLSIGEKSLKRIVKN